MNIQLAKPDITQKEIDAVIDVMKSGILSIGPKVEEFENKLAAHIGVKHAIAVNSGTSGLHLLIKAFGIKEGDEVITTPFSFVASTNCILFEKAVPVFADIDPESLEMDLSNIEKLITVRTKAILAVDIFGHPINSKKIREIADKHNLIFIEDSCEALGSEYDGIKSGSLSDGAVFAFYPNKQITTGEGGMIVTNNDYISEVCRSYRSQGRAITGFWLHHERIGYNYRMSEINAAIGSVQMDRLEEIIEKRKNVAEKYKKHLSKIEGVKLPYLAPEASIISWFVYVIRLDSAINRDGVMEFLKNHGVACRPYFTPIHIQPYMIEMFGYKEDAFPHTSDAGKRCIAIPFHNDLGELEIEYIAEILEKAIKTNRF